MATAKSKYFDMFNRPTTIYYPYKGKFVNEYEKVIEDGVETVKNTGKFDMQEFVNAPRDEVLVYNAINRFINGDETALNVAKGFYEDVTQFPKDMMGVHNLATKARFNFEKLPLEVRKQFDNNVNQFIKGFGDGSVAKSLNDYVSKMIPSQAPKEVENNG